jgi:hypothetical protein
MNQPPKRRPRARMMAARGEIAVLFMKVSGWLGNGV